MKCPVCGGKSIGKVGNDQYYCWDCCLEYKMSQDGIQIFELEEDGSLVTINAQRLVNKTCRIGGTGFDGKGNQEKIFRFF